MIKRNRRNFLKAAGAAGLSLGALSDGVASSASEKVAANNTVPDALHNADPFANLMVSDLGVSPEETAQAAGGISVIGAYGPWAASIMGNKLPSLSFRNSQYKSIDTWRP